jgi:hypothetical protein
MLEVKQLDALDIQLIWKQDTYTELAVKSLCRWQLGRDKRYEINKPFEQYIHTFTAAAAWPAESSTKYLQCGSWNSTIIPRPNIQS